MALGAGGAGAEEFEFVVEAFVAGGFANFFFEFVDRAGGFDGVYFSAFGADEVVAVFPWFEKGEVSGALVEAEAADDAMIGESLEEAVDGGFIALVGEAL